MSYLAKTNKQYSRYLILLAVVVLGIASILGSGGGGDSSTTPPAVPAVPDVVSGSEFPAPGSSTALVTTLVTATFNKDMDPLTINTSPTTNNFYLEDSNNTAVTGTAVYSGGTDTASFTPVNDLVSGKEYTATLTTAITDTTGTPLASDHIWSFQIAPHLVLTSTDINGSVGTQNGGAEQSDIDATGEYIVFVSRENLAGHATNGIAQIYRKNTVTGRIDLVSTNSNGDLALGDCATPRISDNTRYVVFASTAQNLDTTISTPGGFSHIYRKDMREGTITMLDIQKGTTTAGNGNSINPDINAQGNYVVFESTASKLLGVDANNDPIDENGNISDIFRYNVNATPGKRMEIVSIATNGDPANSGSFNPKISGDGQRVVFESKANSLISEPLNSYWHIFLHDHSPATPTTELISKNNADDAANQVSLNADVNYDGSYVVFQSKASNLDATGVDGQSYTDIYLRDRTDPDPANYTTTWLSADANGEEANGASQLPSINEDGRYVAFQSSATDLIAAGSSSQTNIFVTDITSGTIVQLNIVDPDGIPIVEANAHSTQPAISTNGRYVSFSTAATNLVGNDPAGFSDIYRAHNMAYAAP